MWCGWICSFNIHFRVTGEDSFVRVRDYEKLVNIEGEIKYAEGDTVNTRSTLINGKWKHEIRITDEDMEPTTHLIEVNLGTLKFKETKDYLGETDSTEGTCEWTEPKTIEIHENSN